MAMLSNHLKIAFRVALRAKTFTLLNLAGLILGMTGALLLFLWIRHELSFDQFHAKRDHLFMAGSRWNTNGQIECEFSTPRILAPTLEDEFSAVNRAVSYAAWGDAHLFRAGKVSMLKTTGAFTDPGFLAMVSLPLIAGDPATALNEPKGIVLTENFAKQLFGEAPALGEPLSLRQAGHSFEFIVTGVMKELPANTAFQFDYLFSFKFLESLGEKDTFWGNNSVTTLVELKEGTDYHAFNEQIKDLEKKHYEAGQNIEIFLHPLTAMRLYSRFENGLPAGGRIDTIRLLGILAAGLIGIAAVNFTNLSTARARRRSREVAVRKVNGALRPALIRQFLSESFLMAMTAGMISIVLTGLLIPYFRSLVNQPVPMPLNDPGLWVWVFCFIFLAGLLAGTYPAIYLSSFKPVAILKGVRQEDRGGIFRLVLVVGQFGFAVMLIVSAIVVQRQLTFVENRDAGYTTNHLLYLPLTGDLRKNFIPWRDNLMASGSVVSLTKTSAPLTEQWSGTTDMEWAGKNPEEKSNIERIYADHRIAFTAGLTVVQGRDLDLDRFPTDSSAALINETALKLMNFSNPMGEVIKDGKDEWHIVGVVKDFVFTSPYQAVEPIILFGNKRKWASNTLYIKLNPSVPVAESIETLSRLSAKYNPEYPFEYHFADADYQRKFDELKAALRVNAIFTSVTILVACLGLLGLSIYMTETRTKEIGIRKVMGGSVTNIARLLGYSSLKPILIAVVLFTPASWFFMKEWLQGYAYHATLDTWVFVVAALATIVIGCVTILYQTIRAAMANPVKSLRSE